MNGDEDRFLRDPREVLEERFAAEDRAAENSDRPHPTAAKTRPALAVAAEIVAFYLLSLGLLFAVVVAARAFYEIGRAGWGLLG
ncbi:MAG: hypothetical protein ACR2KP_04595 [Egibacteraceae bacterium]